MIIRKSGNSGEKMQGENLRPQKAEDSSRAFPTSGRGKKIK